MAAGREEIGRSQVYPWRIRIENARGIIRGTGILLDDRYVLTCAHVVVQEHGGHLASDLQVPADDLYVHFDGFPAISPTSATVTSWGWPTRQSISASSDNAGPSYGDGKDDIGDVAVLKLAVPVTGVPRPVLRRTWRLGQDVRIFGFPSGVRLGEWVQASIAGPSSHPDEWVQLEVKSAARVEPGFSGAAVIDEDTGDVIGMVVAVDKKDDGVTCWMIEVRMIRRYTPLVDDCVAASTSVDPAFLQPLPTSFNNMDNAVLTALTQALGTWLTLADSGGVCVVSGGPASGRAGMLAGLISLVEQQNRDAVPDMRADGPTPARGSIDVAVDATGKTPAEISRQIGAGLSIPTDDPATLIGRLGEIGPPVGVIIDALDSAAQPEALGHDLIEPLAAAAERHGIRLLLGFGNDPPSALRSAVTARLWDESTRPPVAAAGKLSTAAVEHRLATLTKLAGDVDRAEERARQRNEHVAHRVYGAPPPHPASKTALRQRIEVIRALANSPDSTVAASVPAWLDACERMAREALSGADGLVAELDALLRQRDDLRGLLDAYAALATEHGLEEDRTLGVRYARARNRLLSAPCDLHAAEHDVASYIREVRRRSGGDVVGVRAR